MVMYKLVIHHMGDLGQIFSKTKTGLKLIKSLKQQLAK